MSWVMGTMAICRRGLFIMVWAPQGEGWFHDYVLLLVMVEFHYVSWMDPEENGRRCFSVFVQGKPKILRREELYLTKGMYPIYFPVDDVSNRDLLYVSALAE